MMVFIGNPRRGTNDGGGDRIILRSIHSKLHLQNTCSILSTKIEVVEVGVVRGFTPNIFLFRGVHAPILQLLMVWSIMSTSKEVEMVVGRVVIPKLSRDG